MITLWSRHKSMGAIAVGHALADLGYEARLICSSTCPAGAIQWGRASNKYQELLTLADAGLPVPAVRLSPAPGYIGRNLHHMEANDLRHETGHDFWVKKLDIDHEFRFHIWKGRSIRRQHKVPTPGAHPWIRSYASGWRLQPGGEATPAMRLAAVAAVKALGYDFGAVDIGRLRGSQKFVIFEVNSRPGVEGSTARQYARAIVGDL